MYVVIRRWSDAPALAEALTDRRQEVEDLLRDVPGFVAYYALRHGEEVSTITVCDDQAGTQESTRRAQEWVKQHLAGVAVPAPQITEGETFLQFAR